MTDNNDSSPRWKEWLQEFFSNGESESQSSRFLTLISQAADEEILDVQILSLFKGVYEIRDLKASDVMVPRALMTCVRVDDQNQSLTKVLVQNRHSRFPVIGEDIDDVRGILHAKDILPWLEKGEDLDELDVKDIMRKPVKVPENKSLTKLLQEFRTSRNHMAIVVNEYGTVSGLITIEDVLEQIVGDIEDEHDVREKEERVIERDKGEFQVDARLPIVEFNEEFESEFSNEEFDTIGGIVVNQFDKVPTKGDECSIEGFIFQILEADPRRVHMIMVRPP